MEAEDTRPERESQEAPGQREPLILWWMPVVALLAPLIWAAWSAVSTDSNALRAAAEALVWPGIALYLGAVAVLWAGWKIELE
jgi:hypothetical protein